MVPRIPKRLNLGLAVIDVRLVTRAEMAMEMECETDDPVPEGAWVDEDDAIYLRNDLTAKRKREVLFHELGHAMIDLREHTGGTHEKD